MTLRSLYSAVCKSFRHHDIPDAAFEASLLIQQFCQCSRAQFLVHGHEIQVSPAQQHRLEGAVSERICRRPLQYILGSWPFLDLDLQVGEGVLIPRDDTVVLVEAMAERLDSWESDPMLSPHHPDSPLMPCHGGARSPYTTARSPHIKKSIETAKLFGIDLCSGTGVVALALCRRHPNRQMAALELSDAAYPYLLKNLSAYPEAAIRPIQGDLFSPVVADALPPLDFLTANPPYIATKELPQLQPEVQKEPALALDGGPDGLRFYRCIAGLWLPKLRPGGWAAVEIGEDQGPSVSALFASAGLSQVQVLTDLAGLPRVVLGQQARLSTGGT